MSIPTELNFASLARFLEARLPGIRGPFRVRQFESESEPRVVALLDWELTTLGEPLADLSYCCMSYHLPESSGRGFLPGWRSRSTAAPQFSRECRTAPPAPKPSTPPPPRARHGVGGYALL